MAAPSLLTPRLAWRPALAWLVASGLFMLASAWLGPGLVYAKLQSDAEMYLVQARHLWQAGSAWNFSLAPGLPSIVYAPLSAWLRAPLFGLTDDPAALVQLLQLQNLLILGLLVGVSQAYLRCRLQGPNARIWAKVPWFCIPITYNPWVLNAFMPMADHLFALLTMAVLLMTVLPPAVGRGWRWARLLLTLGLVALAGTQKLTGLALLPVVLLNLAHRGDWRWLLPASAVVLWVALGLHGDVHRQTFVAGAGHYLTGREPLAVIGDTAVNLLVAALPNQLIPNFSILLNRDFTATHAVGLSALTPANSTWVVLGLALSAVVVSGAWRERARLKPELLLLATTLPVYAMASNSTSRYLASVQPVFWVLALAGGVPLLQRFRRHARLIGAGAAISALVFGGLMSVNIARSFTAFQSGRPDELPHFLRALSSTFAQGHQRVADLVRQSANARFVPLADDIRWYALDGARYIALRDAASAVCRGMPVYTVSACDARNCGRIERLEQAELNELRLQGLVAVQVYEAQSPVAVFRIDRWQRQSEQACGPA